MGDIDGYMGMCKHWIFITLVESCVLTAGDHVCDLYKLIDPAVSQCNRSFCCVLACKIVEQRAGGRAD